MEMYAQSTKNTAEKQKLSLDLRLVVLALLAVIVGMLLMWKPWSGGVDEQRTLEITGEATLTDTPDEFIFNPSYQFTNPDKDAALAELTAKSNDVVAKLKELGVEDSKIKTNSSGYDFPVYIEDDTDELTYTLQLTITLSDRELAQKVQDYLLSTSPAGLVSPLANFSDAKRRELESKARLQAAEDARQKAEQSAEKLGAKVGKVKSVTDNQGFGVLPYAATDASEDVATRSSLTLQPGENELTYTVTVVFYLK